MLCEVDVGSVVFQDDIVDSKTSSLRQPHARVGDESDKPSGLNVLHSTVSLYAPDDLKRYGLASLVVLKVRQIDTEKALRQSRPCSCMHRLMMERMVEKLHFTEFVVNPLPRR